MTRESPRARPSTLERTVGALTILILCWGCGEDRSTVVSPCINLVDRSRDAMSVGVWSPPEEVRISSFRVADLSKRCVRIPAGSRVELPAAPVVSGGAAGGTLPVQAPPVQPVQAVVNSQATVLNSGARRRYVKRR